MSDYFGKFVRERRLSKNIKLREFARTLGYDAGNWFDDFQNYLTEAPGNPYDYHFFNHD